MPKIKIWDNEGKTIDRYLVKIDNDFYCMSSNPLSPQGVNQYVGSSTGYIQDEKEVDFDDLPLEVQKAIRERKG